MNRFRNDVLYGYCLELTDLQDANKAYKKELESNERFERNYELELLEAHRQNKFDIELVTEEINYYKTQEQNNMEYPIEIEMTNHAINEEDQWSRNETFMTKKDAYAFIKDKNNSLHHLGQVEILDYKDDITLEEIEKSFSHVYGRVVGIDNLAVYINELTSDQDIKLAKERCEVINTEETISAER